MVRPVSYSSVGKKSTEEAFVLPRIRGRNTNVERRAVPRTAQRWRVPQGSLSVSLFLVALFVSMSSAGCVCLELLCQIPSCSPPGKKSFLLEKECRYRRSTVFELDLLNTQEIISANQEQHQQDPWQTSQNPRKTACHFMVLAQPPYCVHLTFFLEGSQLR